MDDEILKAVADTVTAESTPLEIKVEYGSRYKKWLQKIGHLPKQRTFLIRPITYGNLQRISKLFLGIGIERGPEEAFYSIGFKLLDEHARTVAEIIAVAVSNSKEYPSRQLIDLFYWNLSAGDTANVLTTVIKQMNLSAFMTTIVSIQGVNILETSQQMNGS